MIVAYARIWCVFLEGGVRTLMLTLLLRSSYTPSQLSAPYLFSSGECLKTSWSYLPRIFFLLNWVVLITEGKCSDSHETSISEWFHHRIAKIPRTLIVTCFESRTTFFTKDESRKDSISELWMTRTFGGFELWTPTSRPHSVLLHSCEVLNPWDNPRALRAPANGLGWNEFCGLGFKMDCVWMGWNELN